MFDIAIIGAGAVGAFLARELSKYKLDIVVLEKNNDVGSETSSANSAIVHSGYDPLPNSLKAKLNVLGNSMFDQLAEELDFSFERIGSLTLSTSLEGNDKLNELAKRAKENGVLVKLLNREETLQIEPNIASNVQMSLLAPSTGIVDPFNMVIHAMENALDNGVKLLLEHKVIDIINKGEHFTIKTNKDDVDAKIVINAAGLYSEVIARMVEDVDWKITPRKGEYFVLDHFDKYFDNHLVSHVIFPLPSSKGKGILVTRTTSSNYLVGPNSELVDELDDFSTNKSDLNEIKKQAQNMIDNIPFDKTIRVFAGLRASSSRHDFIIEPAKVYSNFINVAGIESPGLVSSPAIARYVIDNYISKLISLVPNPSFNPNIKKYFKMKNLSIEDKEKMIKSNPNYGKIVCNCEQISVGEIEDLFTRKLYPRSVKAVKRRLRAGFGQCQGGFCSPIVLQILAKKLNTSPLEVLYDQEGSNFIKDEVKKADHHD